MYHCELCTYQSEYQSLFVHGALGGTKNKHRTLLFVIGTQRCGSTLLTRILSSHPSVHIQNELPLSEVFIDGEQPDTTRRRLVKSIASRLSEETSDFLENHAVWGLKDPQLTEYLSVLSDFVDARFIVLVRDPRAVVNSYMENRWGLGTNAYTGALRWSREVTAQLAFKDDHDANCLLMRFEDLVYDVEGAIDKLCKYLGVPADKAMNQYYRKAAAFTINSENINTNRKVDPTLAEKWREDLTEKQIGIIETVAASEMHALGYTPEAKPANLKTHERFLYRLHQRVIGELQLQYQLRRRKLQKIIKRKRKKLL